MGRRIRKLFLLLFAVAFVNLFITLSSDAVQFRSCHLQKRMRHGQQMSPHRYLNEARMRSSMQGTSSRVSDSEETPLNVTLETTIQEEMQRDLVTGKEGKRRTKRGTFAWPPTTLFIAQFSLEIPLAAPDGVSIPLLLEVPFEFDVPNVTESLVAERSITERLSFFETVEALFSRFGMEGKSCMLRAICERAEAEVLTTGLMGEILSLILEVSTSGMDSSIWDVYKEAEYHGRSIGDCKTKYWRCPFSIFHFFD